MLLHFHSLPLDFVPVCLRLSPLMKKGGFDVFEGLCDSHTQDLMLREALTLSSTAPINEVSTPDHEEVRGGAPPRRFLSASGGQVQEQFYQASWMHDFLRQVTGLVFTPSGRRGTYTYYINPGDHLALHRDIETCDLAVITCLYESSDRAGSGGMLYLYPGRLFAPLSVIRANPQEGAVKLRLLPGQTLVLFGGIVPHAVYPVMRDQARIVSVLCYQIILGHTLVKGTVRPEYKSYHK